MKKWQTNQFKKLEKEWNEKLKESGFEDIEKEFEGEKVLRHYSGYAYRRKETVEVVRENKLSYFMLLAKCIHEETDFKDYLDRLIMERTAEGCRIWEISEELKKLLPIGKQRGKFHRNTIRYVRRRYEDKWGIRKWSKEQMRVKKALIRS